MVILPNTALEGAQKIAEAIKHSVKTSNVLPRGEHFTTSIGIAIAQHVDNALTIFQRVDSALYEAKKHKKSKSRSNK